jgi:large subunit ribosomal protein L13
MDTGDYVIIVNASKAVLTGKKLDQKVYYHHSGYAGGLKETKYRKLMAEKPEFAVRHAVVGMLPKGPLGRQMAKKLKVYAGAAHEHEAQKPEVIVLDRTARGGKE